MFFTFLSSNNLKAEERIAYLDIDFILTNTIAGKSLLENLKKQEELKISKLNHPTIRICYIDLLINFMYNNTPFYYGNILAKWGIQRVSFII